MIPQTIIILLLTVNFIIIINRKNTLNRCQQPLYKLLRVIQIVTTIAIVIGIIGYAFTYEIIR